MSDRVRVYTIEKENKNGIASHLRGTQEKDYFPLLRHCVATHIAVAMTGEANKR